MSNSKILYLINELQKEICEEKIDPTKGLPEELFLFSTTLAPVVNVDLLITNNHEILLSWRDDVYYGSGWHIPGGCVRLKERIETRIQKTALEEIGCRVTFSNSPLLIKQLILEKNRPDLKTGLERCHNISLLFDCKLENGYTVTNEEKNEHSTGYLKWFDHVPNDMLDAHKNIYGEYLKELFNTKR